VSPIEEAFIDYIETHGVDVLQSSYMKLELGIANDVEQRQMARMLQLMKDIIGYQHWSMENE
jgi:hypothetical protein